MVQESKIDRKKICVGVIKSAHGIQGIVKIKSYTDNPSDIAKYGPVYIGENENKTKIKIISVKNDVALVRIDGVLDRNSAEDFRNTQIFVNRSDLPPVSSDQEFYYEDLIGIDVIKNNGKKLGKVHSVYNYGASDIIEVELEDGGFEMFPFTSSFFPKINMEENYIVIVMPIVEYVNDNNVKEKEEDK